MTTHQESVDVLAIGAHPDDVELGCGGLLAKLSSEGKRIAILDLTRGELSTRGTPNERHAESEHAAAILGLCARENAGLPDGGLSNTPEQRLAVIPFIRRFRPKVVLTLMTPDRHPDHEAAHYLREMPVSCPALCVSIQDRNLSARSASIISIPIWMRRLHLSALWISAVFSRKNSHLSAPIKPSFTIRTTAVPAPIFPLWNSGNP